MYNSTIRCRVRVRMQNPDFETDFFANLESRNRFPAIF